MALLDGFSLRLGQPVSVTGLVALLLLALVAYWTLTSVVAWQRLRHIPGPPGAGWSKWWMLRNTMSGNMHLALQRACDEYGKLKGVVRLSCICCMVFRSREGKEETVSV
jgi:hypothetical protein